MTGNVKQRETFTKGERLCSLKTITFLFEEGYIFHTSLFKVIWRESPSELPFPAQVLFSIPKRNIRLAVDRNLAKRRMREAWRKNKHALYSHLESNGKQLVLAIILKMNTVPDHDAVGKSVKGILTRLISLTGDRSKC